MTTTSDDATCVPNTAGDWNWTGGGQTGTAPSYAEGINKAREAKRSQDEANWAEKIGKPTLSNLRDMVAALECDYDRLTELKDERDGLADELKEAKEAEEEAREALSVYGTVAAEDEEGEAEAAALAKALEEAGLTVNAAQNALTEWDEENAEELKELEEAAGECKDREDAQQRIEEDPLSVQVRSDWVNIGEEDFGPCEFQILLSTGGPATRIMGELDANGEPSRAWLEVQDWFKPWTEYHEADVSDLLCTYARCFCFQS